MKYWKNIVNTIDESWKKVAMKQDIFLIETLHVRIEKNYKFQYYLTTDTRLFLSKNK